MLERIIDLFEDFPIQSNIMDFKLSHDPEEITKKLEPIQEEWVSVTWNEAYDMGNQDASRKGEKFGVWTPWTEVLNRKELLSLKEEIFNCVKEFNDKFKICEEEFEITNSWYNNMGIGAEGKFHVHEGSLITGVYYPNLPEGAVPLSFMAPYDRFNERACRTLKIEEGHLYIFSSALEHGSVGYNNCERRMVISFNTQLVNYEESEKEWGPLEVHQKSYYRTAWEMEGEELEKFKIEGKKIKNIQELFELTRPKREELMKKGITSDKAKGI